MPIADDWADAYWKQARAEWRVWKAYSTMTNMPECVRLHLLQMAMEKLGKAYRLRTGAITVQAATTSHVSFEKTINAVLAVRGRHIFPKLEPLALGWLRQHLGALVRDIERLCPAVDRVNTPANSEYPWLSGQSVVSPVDCEFAEIRRRLVDTNGLRFLKVIDATFAEAEPSQR